MKRMDIEIMSAAQKVKDAVDALKLIEKVSEFSGKEY